MCLFHVSFACTAIGVLFLGELVGMGLNLVYGTCAGCWQAQLGVDQAGEVSFGVLSWRIDFWKTLRNPVSKELNAICNSFGEFPWPNFARGASASGKIVMLMVPIAL